MKLARLGFTSLIFFIFSVQGWSQQSAAEPRKSQAIATRNPEPASAPATPTEHAIQLLQRAESEFAGLSPAAASTICLQVAQGFAKAGQRKREAELLEQCFKATLLIQDDTEQRRSIQMNIAAALSKDAPTALNELMGVAEPEVKGMVEGIRLERDVAEKKYDEAISRINTLSRLPGFPYHTAIKLMLALPPEREADRRAIFASAVENYRLTPDDDPRLEDLGTLIVRYWKHFPAESVIDAMDEVLKRDKKRSEGKTSISLTIATNKGEANFSSGYQYRLFQFLPILQEIDPGRAKSLLRDNAALESSLKKFPSGMGSLHPSMTDSDGDDGGFSITYNLRPENDPKILEEAKQQREIKEIASSADKDPKEALKRAAALPDDPDWRGNSAKAYAFLNIAYKLWHTDSENAKDALSQSLKASKDFPLLSRCNHLFRATGLYLRMQDAASAAKVLEEAGAIAKKFYEIDTNRDKPNLAFKLEWPSAAAWRGVTVLSSKLSLAETLQMVSKLPDDEIRLSAQVTLANSILGAPLPSNQVREKFTEESPGSFRMLQIPALTDLPTPK